MTELDGYLPIGDHGLVGDMRTAALIGADGTIDWYCPGRFDAPSVFAALLDRRRGGFWAISPQGTDWTSRQLYLPDTAVLLTRFSSDDSVVEIQDFMPVGGIDGHRGLVRRMHGVRGRVPMVCTFEPRPDYGRGSYRFDPSAQGARCTGDGAPRRPLPQRPSRTRVRFQPDPTQTAPGCTTEPSTTGTQLAPNRTRVPNRTRSDPNRTRVRIRPCETDAHPRGATGTHGGRRS
jgi:hypothetical protein